MAGIQFILGRSGTGKTRWCIDRICEALAKSDDTPLILLVPEQATYQAEQAILSKPGIAGFSSLRVVSFERLRYLLDGGVHTEAELPAAARQMVVHKILLEQAGRLRLFKGEGQRTGLAGKLTGLLTQLQADNCTARQIQLLAESLASKKGQELAAAKWADIAAVLAAYESFFDAQTFINPDVQMRNASANVAKSAFLKGARLWVDGFSGFSGQERQLLVELLKICDSAHLAFCLEPSTFDIDNEDETRLNADNLFACAEQTCCQLVRIIRKLKLPLEEPVLLRKTLRFSKSTALEALESGPAVGIETDCGAVDHAIEIAACSNVRAETRYIAESISELVRHHNLRYRDIAVVLPEMETYPHYIESAFREYKIPYFLDRPRRMKTHPLPELIGAALQAALEGFKLSDVLCFLKSGLGPLEADTADMLETYARAFDVQGAEWTQTGAWDFAPAQEKEHYQEEHLDAVRRSAIAPLHKLQRTLIRIPEVTAEQFIQAVWELLEELQAAKTLAEWAKEDVHDQRFGHRQVFEKTVELLDQMQAVFGNAPMRAQGWASILTDAFSGLTVKLIPPRLDQVLVGSIERSRHPDIQAIFLAGAAQKHFPVPSQTEGLLTERDYAAAEAFEVTRPAYLDLTHRPYLAYIALTRASKKIVLSYPMLDEKGTAVVPWSGLDLLRRCFAGLEVTMPQTKGQTPERIFTPGQLSRWLCARLGRDRQEDEQTQVAAGVLQCLREAGQAELKEIAEYADYALVYQNAAELVEDTAARLFTFPMKVSASRLGTFAACPYQYFARYALRLERRELAGFEPLDMGSFYHSVLEKMFLAMQADGKNWGDFETTQLDALCRSAADDIIRNDAGIVNFLRRKAHHRAILDAAVETIRAFVPMLGQLGRAGAFRQAAAELEFGKQAANAFVTLEGERHVQLSGRIDRLDIAQVDGQTLAVVFDYKSGAKPVDYAKMLYGLDLQLPIYLLAIKQTADFGNYTDLIKSKVIPVGAFYLPIDSGFESGRLSEIESETQAAFGKARGLFDGRFAQVLDCKVRPQQRSAFFNFYINKDGTPYSYYKTCGALKPEDFETLLSFSKQHIGELVETIASGCVDITPYRLGTQSPCSHCDYRAVCRFDWQINNYNILAPCDKEEALEKMKS